MQVRYQAALRPGRTRCCMTSKNGNYINRCYRQCEKPWQELQGTAIRDSALQQVEYFLELAAQLPDNLLALVGIVFCLGTGKP